MSEVFREMAINMPADYLLTRLLQHNGCRGLGKSILTESQGKNGHQDSDD
jgi:hypothetical protein